MFNPGRIIVSSLNLRIDETIRPTKSKPAINIPLMLPNPFVEIGPLKGLLGVARATRFCVIGRCRNADVDVDRGVGFASRIVLHGMGW